MKHQVTVNWLDGQLSTSLREWQLDGQSQYEERDVIVEPSVIQHLDYYFDKYTYYLSPFGVMDARFPLLAFSYGEGREVNLKLASLVVDAMGAYSSIRGILQWEIADLVIEVNPLLADRITPIWLPENKDYMTTREVVSKALGHTTQRKANLVAQLWHASRCIRQAQEQGWHIISLRGVNAFATHDPQSWVRHPLDWLIKESRFRYIENHENNEIA